MIVHMAMQQMAKKPVHQLYPARYTLHDTCTIMLMIIFRQGCHSEIQISNFNPNQLWNDPSGTQSTTP